VREAEKGGVALPYIEEGDMETTVAARRQPRPWLAEYPESREKND